MENPVTFISRFPLFISLVTNVFNVSFGVEAEEVEKIVSLMLYVVFLSTVYLNRHFTEQLKLRAALFTFRHANLGNN